MDPELPPWEQPNDIQNVPRPLEPRAASAPKLSLGIPPQNHTPIGGSFNPPPQSTPAYSSMSTPPAPMLRPPMPGGRGSNPRAPRLGLSIPPSPNARAINAPQLPQLSLSSLSLNPTSSSGTPPLQSSGPRRALPKLQLATPMGTTSSAYNTQSSYSQAPQNGRPNLTLSMAIPGASASGGSESSAAHSRSGSFGPMDGKLSGPASAISQFSSLSISSQFGGQQDPASAVGSLYSQNSAGGVGMEREGSMGGISDADQAALDRHSKADIQELGDDGFSIAISNKWVELIEDKPGEGEDSGEDGKPGEGAKLGEGGSGAVYKCKLKGHTTVFALKIINTNPDPDVQRQLLRELEFNKGCASEYICAYYSAFFDPSSASIFIAMEYCDGGSLDAVAKRIQDRAEIEGRPNRVGEKVLAKVAEGVLQGLTYLHGKKILHRDIKPSNILLCKTGQVKLCDFGVSGEFGTRGDANTFIGTSFYMAPERITGQRYTITSDVWSTGVTLLEVAQDRFPFPADGPEGGEAQGPATVIDLIHYVLHQPLPTLKDEPEKGFVWTANFKDFIKCCLERDAERRASPWRMLEHPWMVAMKRKRVNMSLFLTEVYKPIPKPN